ncbi:MAG: phosphonate C-P lyase system protein PhnH [Sulfitobacter sp.]
MQADVLEGGFDDPAVDASHAFRAVMTAMARPGDILSVGGAQPPAPLGVAAGVVLLTLCDAETPIFLGGGYDTGPLRDWITFHIGAPFVRAQDAMFAIGTWRDLPLGDFSCGTPEYPDRSATLIVEQADLTATGMMLTGPGIETHAQLSLPETQAFQQNARRFPLGLDFIFTSADRLAALPRTTKVS